MIDAMREYLRAWGVYGPVENEMMHLSLAVDLMSDEEVAVLYRIIERHKQAVEEKD